MPGNEESRRRIVKNRTARPKLRRARVRLFGSLERAADEVCKRFPHIRIDERQLGRWESGETANPRPANVWAVSKTYGLPPEELDLPSIGDADSTHEPEPSVPYADALSIPDGLAAAVADGEFVSVPVRTANGVIAYVITRRAFVATLATAAPAMAEAGKAIALLDNSSPLETPPRANEQAVDQTNDAISHLTSWVTETNTHDQAIEQLEETTSSLAKAHTSVPARRMLAEVLRIHTQAQATLRGGKQRLRQTRALLRVESDLLAQACMLIGDLGDNERAAQYGRAALLYAQEAGANEAIAWSARAKTARWQRQFVESADLARHGFEAASGATPTRVELAYREANAAALLGDAIRAREASRRAERAAESLTADDTDRSVWSFSIPRQAIFAMSVAIHTGDPDAALRAAARADNAWNSGTPRIEATWAQVRAGAGIAYLMKGALDGTIEQTTAVLNLPPELRIDTVTAYLRELERRLHDPLYTNNRKAIELRDRIREFCMGVEPTQDHGIDA
jgi:hypothetical protein